MARSSWEEVRYADGKSKWASHRFRFLQSFKTFSLIGQSGSVFFAHSPNRRMRCPMCFLESAR